MSVAPSACPSCGARNPVTAEWCSQCYTSLVTSPGAAPEETSTQQPGEPPLDPVGPPSKGAEDASDGRFRVVGDAVEWRCVTCEAWNGVDDLRCTVCSTPMDGGTDSRRAPVDPARVRRAALLVPAGGQWVLGDRGRASARMLTAVVWLVGALGIVVAGAGGAATVVPALVLVLGVAVLWTLSSVDATTAAAGGRRELLGGRAFLWLVVGVLGAVIVSLLLQVLARTGS